MSTAAPTDVVEKIETVIPAVNQVGRVAHVAVGVCKTNCRKAGFARIMRHALEAGLASEVDSTVLTFLAAGDSKKAEPKLVNEVRSKDMDLAHGGVSCFCRDVITKAGNKRFVEIRVSVRLECRHVRVGHAGEDVIPGSHSLIHAQRKLILVIPQAG